MMRSSSNSKKLKVLSTNFRKKSYLKSLLAKKKYLHANSAGLLPQWMITHSLAVVSVLEVLASSITLVSNNG